MIDLTEAVGQEVHVQFKKSLLFIGAKNGLMGPLQSKEGPPITMDQITGSLRETKSGQLVLAYPNPAAQGEKLDLYFDPENVAAAWVVRAVVLATSQQQSQTA